MPNTHTETTAERTLWRQLLCRTVAQWSVFFGLFVVVSVALEFLYGPPQRPSFDLVRQTFSRHGILFAAFFALVPIAIRDSVKSTLRMIHPLFVKTEREHSTAVSSPLTGITDGPVDERSLERHVERLHQLVNQKPEHNSTHCRASVEAIAAERVHEKPVEA